MKSFFGTLKTEIVHDGEYPDRDAARRDLFVYIEGYYNRRRIHFAIGYITPNRQRQNSYNPVSTFPGEGHANDPRVDRNQPWIPLSLSRALL